MPSSFTLPLPTAMTLPSWGFSFAVWWPPRPRTSGFQRLGNRLVLPITINCPRRTANMEWDPLPAVGDVEVVLRARIGTEMRRLGDLQVPPGKRGARG